MDSLKMYFLLKMGIFHSYVSLPEGRFFPTTWRFIFPFGHQHHLLCQEDEETNVGLIGAGCKKWLRFGMKSCKEELCHANSKEVRCFFFFEWRCIKLNVNGSFESQVWSFGEARAWFWAIRCLAASEINSSVEVFEMGLITSWIDSHTLNSAPEAKRWLLSDDDDDDDDDDDGGGGGDDDDE